MYKRKRSAMQRHSATVMRAQAGKLTIVPYDSLQNRTRILEGEVGQERNSGFQVSFCGLFGQTLRLLLLIAERLLRASGFSFRGIARLAGVCSLQFVIRSLAVLCLKVLQVLLGRAQQFCNLHVPLGFPLCLATPDEVSGPEVERSLEPDLPLAGRVVPISRYQQGAARDTRQSDGRFVVVLVPFVNPGILGKRLYDLERYIAGA